MIKAATGLVTLALTFHFSMVMGCSAEQIIPFPSGPQSDGPFRKVILGADQDADGDGKIDDPLKDPMELAVAPDGRLFYAQKSASNPNNLRGKILRIHPHSNGTCTIPKGNLFLPGTPGTRLEIYSMGNRNPFRITVDKKTGYLYWGEVGPDSGGPNPSRGPAGFDEINQARQAGNFGWPYFIADNKPYRQYERIEYIGR